MKWQFIIDSKFLACANDLQKAERASIWKALSSLEKHPPPAGLNVERLKGNTELESLRVSQQFRLIFLRYPQEGTIVLLYVGNHDEAYSWANRAKPPYYKKKETEFDYTDMDMCEVEIDVNLIEPHEVVRWGQPVPAKKVAEVVESILSEPFGPTAGDS
jgi:mRNA-degrading endonuclease RelE of RelBE toxin-antitoxin system